MKQINTQAIVLRRTDFGEADRILHFLTSDQGKISAIARSVRKSHSKLAGSIELFSVSNISTVSGRGDLSTLTSARLVEHYENVVANLDRTNIGYDFISLLNKVTEDNAEPAYFNLLQQAFVALNNLDLNPSITKLWFWTQLIKLTGHSPNLVTDNEGQKLKASKKYNFDFGVMHFYDAEGGIYNAEIIKFLRLCFCSSSPKILQRVEGSKELTDLTESLILTLLQGFI